MAKAGERSKSGDVKTGPAGSGEWDQVLTSCAFEEENWNPCVTWVVGQQPEDSRHVEALNIIIQTGTRKLFSVITKEQLFMDVRELGDPKIKKAKEIPANSEICEACKPYLDADDPIPVPLLAKLIKWKLMAIKAADLKRREADAKCDNVTETIAEKKKAAGKDQKDGGKDRAKSPKKGGKKTPEPQQAKEGSKLRKRGEEDSDSKFIDDEPEDGAQHYIIVTGFHDPRLFQYLEDVLVYVSSVICVSSQEYPHKKTEEEQKTELTEQELKTEELQKELKIFWTDLLPLLRRLPDSSCLHDIARLDYTVKSLIVPTDPGDAEQNVQYSTVIYEDIAVMIYDLLDARRLYKTYLQNLKLAKVPLFGQEEIPDATSQPPPTPGTAPAAEVVPMSTEKHPPLVDMRYYCDLMNTIPQESVSVPLIMHCMLVQLTATEQGLDIPSQENPPERSDGLNHDLATYLSSVTFKLGLSQKEHQILSEVLDLPKAPPETPTPPDLINYHDGIKNNTHHLKSCYGFDPAAVERAMLQFVPFARLLNINRPSSADTKQRALRLQELIHYCATDGLSKSEIDRCFKQFVFECMDLMSTDPNGFPLVKEKEGLHHSAIPWDDPYPYFKIMIPPPERPTSANIPLSTSSDERSANLGGMTGTDGEHFGDPEKFDKSKLLNGKKFGGTGRVSNVMLEMAINLGKGACTPDPLSSSRARSLHSSSMDSKKGILVSGRQSRESVSPKRSRSNSVHWEVPAGQEELDNDLDGQYILNPKSLEENMMEIVEAQKRNLDQWCFAEHYNPDILLQVLNEASYHLPFVETYHHKRDQTQMLVLHNPYNNDFQNHLDWHTELHSNLGFRNYLENTAESIQEWLKEKEAEYQAKILSKEVETIHKEEEEKAKAVEKADAKGKKSPRKSPSRSKSPRGSRGSSHERPGSVSSNPYVRMGSLKAWQAEQSKIAAEEEEKMKAKQEKQEKRVKSAKGQDKSNEDEKDKTKSPKGSAKSQRSKSDDLNAQTNAAIMQEGIAELSETVPQAEVFWPFHGYDMGNQLIHVSGITTTLFPSDGGMIKTERTEFVQGTTAIRSVVQKDKHVFAVHVLNPREDMELPVEYEANLDATESGPSVDLRESMNTSEKSETEKLEKEQLSKTTTESRELTDSGLAPSGEELIEEIADGESGGRLQIKTKLAAVSQFGSITAVLSDGMVLALSQFGASGESYLKPYEPALFIPQQVPETPSLAQAAVSPSKSRKELKAKQSTPEPDKGKKGPSTPDADKIVGADEDTIEEEKKDEEKPLPKQDFQELFVTCPDGLTVKYFLQSSVGVVPSTPDERQLAVKQCYPFKTKGVQECEGARRKYIQTEISRVITADGNVVKNMVDGSVEVLSADGTLSVFHGKWPSQSSRMSSPSRSIKSAEGERQPGKKNPQGGQKSSAKRRKAPQMEQTEESKDIPDVPTWVITYPNGERIKIQKEDGSVTELTSVPVCIATDPDTQQTMATRDDHVITISYPDGTTVVEHADGTRITVYYRESAVPTEMNDDGSTPENAEMKTQTLKFVKVECPAFATVEFNTATSENLTVFGSGTSINVFPDGYYILHHNKGGRVEVDTEGTMVYFPRRSRFLEHLMPERELQYVLRHNADVIVETVDPDGNVFNVRSNGDFNVIPSQGDEALSVDSDEQQGKEKKVTIYGQHAPRFFIIHADKSGTELLRYQDVAEYLMLAEQNPATAVLKDALPDHPGVTGITILKPHLSGVSEKWLKKYDQDTIVPLGIRCRDLKTLPAHEHKKPGPVFGTNVGQGLSIGASAKGPVRIPILKCPKVLELRQIVQYKPMSEPLRNKLKAGLREYAEAVLTRMRVESMMTLDDPRSEDEKILAQDLKSLADSQKVPERECQPDHVKNIYERAVAPDTSSPSVTPAPKRCEADWERDRREIQEETEAKRKIRNKIIEPYFDSELGKAFLLTQASDMDEMMRQLASDTKQGNADAVRGDNNSRMTYTQSPAYPQNIPPSQPGVSVLSDRSNTSESPGTNIVKNNGQDTPLSYAAGMSEAATVTPTGGVRPHNPTPAHATGQGSPAPLRPKNPTPAHAGKMQTDRPGTDVKNSERDLSHNQVLTTNVIGEPRAESVPIPLSILGGRPGAQPNYKFLETEDPVRRKVKTSLVAGAIPKGRYHLNQMRGLICRPEGVNFGVLKEGNTYAYTVVLKNTGVDTCRFKVRQPPPATGLRVIYKPGPVAAGMSVDLSLEIYAIANGVKGQSGVGSMGHVLEIATETDLLEIPVVATVLTASEYDDPQNSASAMRDTRARLISTRPPASSGIIRPRKDARLALTS